MTAELLTPAELAEIRARCDAATPGPWQTEKGRVLTTEIGYLVAVAESVPASFYTAKPAGSLYERMAANAAFIAASRTDVPRLLATIEAMQAVIHRAAFDAGTLMATMPTGVVERLYHTLKSADPLH